MAGAFVWRVLILCTLGSVGTLCRKAAVPRLHLKFPELLSSKRMLSLPLNATDVHSVVLDEDMGTLYVAQNDRLLSVSLANVTSDVKQLHWPANQDSVQQCRMAGKDPKLDCANVLRVLHIYNQTHLFACGTGAFHPRCALIARDVFHQDGPLVLKPEQTECGKGKCPYDPQQHVATAMIDGELYAGISSDFMSRDAGFFRGLGHRHMIRTEQYDSRWLQDPKFVKVQNMAESDNEEDDKVYLFFTERAQEAEGSGGKVIYSRVSRVCKNDIGGQRSLVNKWSTFLKARMVCSIPGPEGIQTHFDELKDIFILKGNDRKDAVVYGVFTTSSNILNGSAVCVYDMEDIVSAFRGQFAHKESPDFKWLPYQGRVPFPRPGTCPSSMHGSYRSTRDYPDDVMFFSRTHPLMYNVIYPINKRPVLVRVGVDYKFTRIVIDRQEGMDGQYDVLFIGTDKGMVLKTTHSPGANQRSEEIFLEEFEVFQHKSSVSSLSLDRKKHWLYIASNSGLSQLATHQCEMYGKVCAECCLARDPYCTWDGGSCSPYVPIPRRRNARQAIPSGDPLMECFKEGVPVQVKPEEKVIVVAEGNGTFLECLPKSRRATVTWVRVANETNSDSQKVTHEDPFVLISQGLVIRRAELRHAGIYHCQIEEEGFRWTLLKVHLIVIPGDQALHPRDPKVRGHSKEHNGSHQPWYKDLMNLINYPSKMDFYCEQVWQREPRKKKNKVGPEASSERRRSDDGLANISGPLSIKGVKNHKGLPKSLRSPRST
ncbi:semaphorin-3A-like [Ambystoma mexicanum]|uniref:semaphorin-3A-like n=1 Tax=Ambystoma mexicanum TaxID=8296 RepID=UPI0037E75F5A